MNVDELATQASLTMSIKSGRNVKSLRYAPEAQEDDIAVARTSREIEETRAKVILTEPRVFLTDKVLLYCNYGDLYGAISRIVHFMYPDNDKVQDYHVQKKIYVGENVCISKNVSIAPMVMIGSNVTIGEGTIIEPHVTIGSNCNIGKICLIHSGARVAADSFMHYHDENGISKTFRGIGGTVIGDYAEIGYNTVVQRGTLSDTILGHHVLVGNLVLIAHDVKIGDNTRFTCQSGVAGETEIGNNVLVLGQAGIVDHIKIGSNTVVMSKSRVTKDIGSNNKISGSYGRDHIEELRIQSFIRNKIRRND